MLKQGMDKALIDDPIKEIANINHHIQKIEAIIDTINDEALLVKYHWVLQNWYKRLGEAMHRAYQQGKTRRDVTQLVGEGAKRNRRAKR